MTNGDLKFMMLGIYGMILLAALLIGFIVFIFKGVLCFKLSKGTEIKNRWLSWIPIGNDYVLLKLGGVSPNYIVVFVAATVFDIIANMIKMDSFVPFYVVYFIITVVQSVVTIYTLNRIKKMYKRGLGLLVIEILYFVLVLLSMCMLI